MFLLPVITIFGVGAGGGFAGHDKSLQKVFKKVLTTTTLADIIVLRQAI